MLVLVLVVKSSDVLQRIVVIVKRAVLSLMLLSAPLTVLVMSKLMREAHEDQSQQNHPVNHVSSRAAVEISIYIHKSKILM